MTLIIIKARLQSRLTTVQFNGLKHLKQIKISHVSEITRGTLLQKYSCRQVERFDSSRRRKVTDTYRKKIEIRTS